MANESEIGQNLVQTEARIQLGYVGALALSLREEVARKLLAGEGTVEEIIYELAAGLGKELTSKPEAMKDAVDVELNDAKERRESAEIDPRLISLVVKPINALSKTQRTVRGRVCSGEEIARAIPDVEAFLHAVSLRKEGKFFELNEGGQLVIADGCPEAYGLGEDFPTAKLRQACVWYLDEKGVTQSMKGEELYTAKEVDGKKFELRVTVKVLELTEAAKKVVPTMKSGLSTLKWGEERHRGEYARMNTGQFERQAATWTDDDLLCASRARLAGWDCYNGRVHSFVDFSSARDDYLGSRGVLRVNLNLEL